MSDNQSSCSPEALPVKAEPDMEFIERLQELGASKVKHCFQCATCSGTCPISPDTHPFPRKEMIWLQWGLKDRLLSDPDVWLCHQCNDCSISCPRGAHPGDVLAAVRNAMFQEYSFPSFMGRALSKVEHLPWLLAIPALLILIILAHAGTLGIPEGEIVFRKFFPLYLLDPLFIVVTVLALTSLGMGLLRFWRAMERHSLTKAPPGGPGVLACLTQVVLELLTHKKFKECDEGGFRYKAHLGAFYGFVACFITTAFVFVGLYLFDLQVPMSMGNPMKILGNLGGVMILFGCSMALIRRSQNRAKAGGTTYYDSLFLWVLILIAATGLLTEVIRLANMPTLAYPTYFVHLVLVFFLLAYMPYSKFAHVFYRTVALTFGRYTNREASLALVKVDKGSTKAA